MSERGFWELSHVTDRALVGELQELVLRGARTDAQVVAHLAELEARRSSLRGGRSLFKYCLECLGLSENQAFYRIAAAKLARQFPTIFELLERRKLHLTSLALVRHHLTRENHVELLSEIAGKTKLEILKVLARRSPRPDAPSTVRKLSMSRMTVTAGPTGSLEPYSGDSYVLRLCTSETLKQKLDLAASLMAHANRTLDLAVVVERGLDLLIEKLEQQRFGKPQRAPRPSPAARSNHRTPSHRSAQQRGHIPREILRQLVERDGLGCVYVGQDGRRCGEQAFLQVHHVRAWAKGGPDTLGNLQLVCAHHNRMLAEEEFGTAHVRSCVARGRS